MVVDQAGKDPGRPAASSKAKSGEESKTSAGKRSRSSADDKRQKSDAEDSTGANDRDESDAALVVPNVRVKDESGDMPLRAVIGVVQNDRSRDTLPWHDPAQKRLDEELFHPVEAFSFSTD